MKKAQRTLAHFLGGGLRLRSARREYLELVNTTLIQNDMGLFMTFSFMLHELNREQVIASGFNTQGGWDQGWIMSVTAQNKIQVRAKSVYILQPDMDGNEPYVLQPGGFYEKIQAGGTMFIGATTLEAGKIYTIAIWEGGRYRNPPQKYKNNTYNPDPQAPPEQRVESEYFYEGHEVWMNGVYQGHCGSTPVSISSPYAISFGTNPKYRNSFSDMTLFHFDGTPTKGVGLELDSRNIINKFFLNQNLHNSGRGSTMSSLHKWLGNERLFSFDFSRNNTFPLKSTISNHRFELQPRYSIQAKNDLLNQQQDFRSHETVKLTSSPTPSTDSPILRDHIFEQGNNVIINLGLTGELDSFDGRNGLPSDYSGVLNVSGNQMSGDSVINTSNLSGFYMGNQTGSGNNNLTWNGQTKVLENFVAFNSKLSSLSFAPGTGIENIFDVNNNPSLTAFNMDNLAGRIPRQVFFDNCHIGTFAWPQSEQRADGQWFGANNTQIPYVNFSPGIHGWRNVSLLNCPALTGIQWPAPGLHQPMESLRVSYGAISGFVDLTPVPGIGEIVFRHMSNITSIAIPPVNGSNVYAFQGLGITTLNLSMVQGMGYDYEVTDNPNLTTLQHPQPATRQLRQVLLNSNPNLTGVQDLRWIVKGNESLNISNCPNVPQWILPDTVDVSDARAIAAIVANGNAAAAPQVLDFTRTKVTGSVNLNGGSWTEIRFSAASWGSWGMSFFSASNCQNITTFDLSAYPTSSINYIDLSSCSQLSTMIFPTGGTLTTEWLNLSSTNVNMVYPVGSIIRFKNATTFNVSNSPINQANLLATIDNIYTSRNLHENTATVKTFLYNSSQYVNLITGVYGPPSGYVQGSADGSPASAREQMYVLREQTVNGTSKYRWDFPFVITNAA